MSAQLKIQNPSLTLKRRINASPAKIYAAWTDPEKLALWWGPGDSDLIEARLDVRVGGRFFILFRSNGEDHGVGGKYREIAPDEKLVFTWAWRSTPERESLVTITITPDGDGAMVTLHHERFADEAARDNHVKGWSSLLDRLERLYA